MLAPDLAEFIDKERLTIVAEWEAFARTLLPAADGLNALALRDHADEILTAIIRDMKSRQTKAEQAEKSKGRGQAHQLGEMGEIHATLRIEIGFRLGQMVAEYRALRASVLRLWEKVGGDPGGVTRFNESIDEALTVAVDSFTETTERYRDQSLGILSHDLRNPLSGIILGATMLMRPEGGGSSGARDDRNAIVICKRILSSARRMDRMIGDLLDYANPRPSEPVDFDLGSLVEETLRVARTEAAFADIEVTGDVARAKVRFLAEFRSRSKGPEGEAVDDKRTAELWTFERRLSSRDPNWTLVRVDAAEA